MKKDKIIEDYYGELFFIEENKGKNLTIFVVDDNEVFLELAAEQLKANTNFNVHMFTTGEECLQYLSLNPDLVILDYHLDGEKYFAQNGSIIKDKINETNPETKVIIVSSDHKLTFLQNLQNTNKLGKVMFKDGYIIDNIKNESILLDHQLSRKSPIGAYILFIIIAAVAMSLYISF